MKKFAALLIAPLLAFSISACSSADDTEKDDTKSSSEESTKDSKKDKESETETDTKGGASYEDVKAGFTAFFAPSFGGDAAVDDASFQTYVTCVAGYSYSSLSAEGRDTMASLKDGAYFDVDSLSDDDYNTISDALGTCRSLKPAVS